MLKKNFGGMEEMSLVPYVIEQTSRGESLMTFIQDF